MTRTSEVAKMCDAPPCPDDCHRCDPDYRRPDVTPFFRAELPGKSDQEIAARLSHLRQSASGSETPALDAVAFEIGLLTQEQAKRHQTEALTAQAPSGDEPEEPVCGPHGSGLSCEECGAHCPDCDCGVCLNQRENDDSDCSPAGPVD
jgi:hypothetical protein